MRYLWRLWPKKITHIDRCGRLVGEDWSHRDPLARISEYVLLGVRVPCSLYFNTDFFKELAKGTLLKPLINL